MNQTLAFNIGDVLFGDHPQAGTVAQDTTMGFTRYITILLPNFYWIAGLILFFYILFGGFLLISSAGNAEKSQQGQKVISNAIMGFVLIIASYWIIQIIQVITGIPILSGLITI